MSNITPTDPAAILIALALAQSVIKCGEPWTDTCENTFKLAFAAAEALQERVAELEGALVNIEDQLREVFMQDDWEADCLSIFEKIRTALSSTPAKALERARSEVEAVNVLRGYYATEFGRLAMVKQVGIFLAKLDQSTTAPGGEER